MKKVVLTFGAISGGVSALLMLLSVPVINRAGFAYGHVIGYIGMVISFLFVYFGIKSYRDNVLGGHIAFGRAFGAGVLITLISSVFYVVGWQFVYHNFMPDFLDQYGAYFIESLKAKGASAVEVAQKAAEIADFKALYANPLVQMAFSFLEPLPVGILITLISAAVLRRPARLPQSS